MSIKNFSENQKRDLAYLVGALADGTIYHNKKYYVHRVSYYQQSKEYLEKCIEPKIIILFNKRGHFYFDARKGVYFYEITSKIVYNIFIEALESFKNKKLRRVPIWIKAGNKDLHYAFIKGFFEADGYYHIRPENSDYRVRLGQSEFYILLDIKTMLNGMFKCSKVLGPYQAKTKPHVKPYYELHIHGINQVKKFHELIKPCHPRKKLNLEH